MKKLQKTAKSIINNLNGVVTFDSVVQHLQSKGYTVMFYSSPEGKALLEKYELTDFSQKLNALTYFNDSIKVVFVDDHLSKQDMLCTLLHETAHIYLGHLSLNPFSKDKRRNEMEAEALAYAVLNYKKSRTPLIVTSAVVSTAIITSMFSSYYHDAKTPTFVIERQQISETETISVPQLSEPEPVAEIVYVTPSGKKFHKEGCRYIKDKNVKEYSRTDAAKKYSPCSVCEP